MINKADNGKWHGWPAAGPNESGSTLGVKSCTGTTKHTVVLLVGLQDNPQSNKYMNWALVYDKWPC